MALHSGKVVYRSREQSVIAAVAGMFLFGFMSVLAFKLASRGSVVAGFIFIFWALIVGVFYARVAAAGVVVLDRDFTVRNPRRSTRLTPEEIARFTIGTNHLTAFPKAGVAVLEDGREIVIFGIQKPNLSGRAESSRTDELILQLNLILTARKSEKSKALGSVAGETGHLTG